MILGLILIAMTMTALALVLAPLLAEARTARARARFDLAVYRDQIAEIERDVARGLVKPEDAESAKREIERRIIASGSASDAPGASPPKKRLAALLAAGVAVGAFGFYLLTGVPGLPDLPFASRSTNEAEAAMSVQDMVNGLAAKLQANPDDADGWIMLGRSYEVLGDSAQSAAAYEHARNLRPGDESVELAEAEALLSDRKVEDPLSDRILALLKSINLADPDQPLALWYLGFDAAQHGRLDEARRDWTHLLQVMPAGAHERQTVNDALATISGKR
jgi:cytochrome c-type biogenesis protein CcmH